MFHVQTEPLPVFGQPDANIFWSLEYKSAQ